MKETNEEVVSQSVKTDDDSDCNRDSDSEEEMPDDSDDDGYNRYGGYNEYGERDRGYYYRLRLQAKLILEFDKSLNFY